MNIADAKDFLYKIQSKKNKSSSTETVDSNLLLERKNVLDLKIVIGIDISGSISSRQFHQFMQQIDAIRGLSKVMVIHIDTKICSMYNYYKTPDAQYIKLKGGGGTMFKAFFDKAQEMRPDAILMMTDGQVFDQVEDPGIPTGWVLTHDGVLPYGFGKEVVRLPKW